MKFILVLFFLFNYSKADAQFWKKLIKKAEQKIEREADNRAEKRVNKKIDKTFDTAENTVDGKIKKKKISDKLKIPIILKVPKHQKVLGIFKVL